MYTVGVCKPGEPDKGRHPSQPEPSKPGKGKIYNTGKQYKCSLQYISTNRQPNQPEPSKPDKLLYKIQVNNTNEHTAINPIIVQLAWQIVVMLCTCNTLLATSLKMKIIHLCSQYTAQYQHQLEVTGS